MACMSHTPAAAAQIAPDYLPEHKRDYCGRASPRTRELTSITGISSISSAKAAALMPTNAPPVNSANQPAHVGD